MRYSKAATLLASAAAVVAAVAVIIEEEENAAAEEEPPLKKRRTAIRRFRRGVEDIFRCSGEENFRRAYRMTYESFWILHDKLEYRIRSAVYAV